MQEKNFLTETELWREERSHSCVEREMKLEAALERRKVELGLCEFVCGAREVRIPIAADQHHQHNHPTKHERPSSRVAAPSSTSSNSASLRNTSAAHSSSSSSSFLARPDFSMHQLKYFSTRATNAPLSVPLNGAVDEPDARYHDIRTFLARRSVLSGKAVRAGLRNLAHQVSQLHVTGGCSHNDIAFRSVCLAQNAPPSSSSSNNKKTNNASASTLQQSTAASNSSSNEAVFLLTRFGYATEFSRETEFVSSQQQEGGTTTTQIKHRTQTSKLAIAPNLLALCEDGSSAEKNHRQFLLRQDAERHNRAQARRPLPLSVPICGPTCDVQGLAAITACLFRHLLSAGDDLLQQGGENDNKSASPDRNSPMALRGPVSASSPVAYKKSSHDNTGAGGATAFANHKFWSCDIELALKKYIAGSSDEYLAKAVEWLRERGGSVPAVRVLDEVVSSPQLAAFRVESLAANNTNNMTSSNTAASTNTNKADDAAAAAAGGERCTIATCGAPAVELRWLLSRVLSQQRLPLPSARQLMTHPFFWSSRRTAQFIVACAQFLCDQDLVADTLKQFCNFPSSSSSSQQQNQQSESPSSPASGTDGESRHKNSSGVTTNASGVPTRVTITPSNLHDPDAAAKRAADKLRCAIGSSPFAGLGSGHSPARHAATLGTAAASTATTTGGDGGDHQSINGVSPIRGTDVSELFAQKSNRFGEANDMSSADFALSQASFGNYDVGSGGKQIGKPTSSSQQSSAASFSLESGVFDKEAMTRPDAVPAVSPKRPRPRSNTASFVEQQDSIGIPPGRRKTVFASSPLLTVTDSSGQEQDYAQLTPQPKKKTKPPQQQPERRNSVVKEAEQTKSATATSTPTPPSSSANSDPSQQDEPNSVAKMLSCSGSVNWWGHGEFRADALAHKNNCAVWLRMLTDTIGSSQHPFSTANTRSGRIRNSRSDLLLFIAAIIAKMLNAERNVVKISGGDAMSFVSLAVHSRFPGLQMILLELLSRRATDAQKFCQFVADQESAVTRGSATQGLAMPLFGATAKLWTAPGLPPFAEELAEVLQYWA